MQFPNASQARYVSRRHAEFEELRKALQNSEFPIIQDTGHRWKGSGVSYGFAELSRLGEKLEVAAQGGDATQVEQLLKEFERWLSEHPVPAP